MRTARDFKRNTRDQRLSALTACLGEHAPKGMAGDAHAGGRFGLGEAFEVGKAQGCELFELERNAFG